MIRKKKRKNPITQDYIMLLGDALYFGSARALSDALTILKQGDKCDDCEKLYHWCECEKCDDCWFNRCLCYLDYHDKSQIKKEAFRLIKETLNKNQIKELKTYVSGTLSSLDDKEYKKLEKQLDKL